VETKTLSLNDIRIDGGTQSRVTIDEATVLDYAEAMAGGAAFPPVVVFYDGACHWLADGFHRYFAARKTGREDIQAEVRRGLRRDAILHSVGANSVHGLRRSLGDKRKAVTLLLADDEWGAWSDQRVADQCGVSRQYVNRIRNSLATVASEQTRRYVNKHGTTGTMNTRRIGQSSKRRPDGEGRIAKDAYRPRQFHGEDGPVPMRTIAMPLNNPQQAARSMIGLYGEDYIRQLVHELNLILKGEPSND